MKTLFRTLPLILIALALCMGGTGCKKKMPAEEPPPAMEEPAIEPVEETADTTGQAMRELMARIETDLALVRPVYFDFDRSDIRPDQRGTVTSNAEIFNRWPDWTVTVEGHCDERGTVEYNFALGERRARATERALIGAGIDPARLSIVSFGEERPVDPGHNESAWSRNRRAAFKVDTNVGMERD